MRYRISLPTQRKKMKFPSQLALATTLIGLLYAQAASSQVAVYRDSTAAKRFVFLEAGPSNNRLKLQFDTQYGGSLLDWWYGPLKIGSPDPKPGTGFQLTYDTGQDSTQAGANGVTPFPIARTGVSAPDSEYFNYFARDQLSSDTYSVTGFAPIFWISHEAPDDSVPHRSNGTQQLTWKTLYNPGSHTSPEFWGKGVPVFFEGTPATPSGILLIGDTLSTSTRWNERLWKVKEGRFAMRTRVSMAQASDGSIAGVMFRRQIPAGTGKNMDHAFNAPGYSLYLYRNGTISVVSGNGTTLWSLPANSTRSSKIRSAAGIQVELRTYNFDNNRVDVLLDKVLVGTVPNCTIRGENFGLFAQCGGTGAGTIKFFDREFFDVGIEFKTSFKGLSNGVVESEMSVGPAPGISISHTFYRVNTVAFLLSTPTSLNWGGVQSNRNGALSLFSTGAMGSMLLGRPGPYPNNYGLWAGRNSGTQGLYCVPISATINGAPAPAPHALVQAHTASGAIHMGSFIHLNALNPPGGGAPKVTLTRASIKARWAGKVGLIEP